MTETPAIRWAQDEDGVVVLTLDDPANSANLMNDAYLASMAIVIERLEAQRDDITGVVLTSAKRSFFAGADLRALRTVEADDADALDASIRDAKEHLRRLETLGRPVVAAIAGHALGFGLELALAAHHRIAVDDPTVQIGLPEVTLGLLPGGGGVVRTVRLLGAPTALSEVLLSGRRHSVSSARSLGLIDEVVATPEQLLPAAKDFIAATPDAAQPWDVEGAEIPSTAELAASRITLAASLRKQLKGANYPAPHHILAAAIEGAGVDFDTALTIEGRYFLDLITGPVAKNMLQSVFFDTRRVGTKRAHDGGNPWRAQKAVILGAGMMGAGIAYVCADAGIEVVLKDVSQETAERGKQYSRRLVERAIADGRWTRERGDALLERIVPTGDDAAAAGADLAIEAVFEDPALKAEVLARIEPLLGAQALLGSNTSTLPITGLAEGLRRPADFIGLHFFSPVDKMSLLEIVKGQQTSAESIDRALDFARQIGKTPIVVGDSRGFFTSRVITTFVYEGVAMLLEGIPASTIEQASAQAGYPVPVLQLSDELNLELMAAIGNTAKEAAQAGGDPWVDPPAVAVIERMVAEGRSGRLAGAGFYSYEDGRRSGLWPGLRELFAVTDDPQAISLHDLKERLLFVEAIESVKCLDEGVLESVADANVGSTLGIGYPAWTGGVLQFINGYEGGLAGFVARARELADAYGERFVPPDSLVARAERDEPYRDTPDVLAAAT